MATTIYAYLQKDYLLPTEHILSVYANKVGPAMLGQIVVIADGKYFAGTSGMLNFTDANTADATVIGEVGTVEGFSYHRQGMGSATLRLQGNDSMTAQTQAVPGATTPPQTFNGYSFSVKDHAGADFFTGSMTEPDSDGVLVIF